MSKKQSGATGGPTPNELIQIAATLSPEALRSAGTFDQEAALAGAFGVWTLAQEVILRCGETRQQQARAEAELADAKNDVGAPSDSEKVDYPLNEAWRELGFKDTRGERSLFELVAAAEKAGAFGESGVSGGLVKWIRDLGRVDQFQLKKLIAFKANRKARGHSA